ncbi:hypothetical protein EVAR_6634_1 [Eumeta japonica]|uniref:Uncharacterized protein n=1 Tax=Eumeta variegata TaxID=151549 RepID=A0A4C1TLA1_EUMVA|nr:hypothetical protein EVAR_6634_1 [Eumeta japonica]
MYCDARTLIPLNFSLRDVIELKSQTTKRRNGDTNSRIKRSETFGQCEQLSTRHQMPPVALHATGVSAGGSGSFVCSLVRSGRSIRPTRRKPCKIDSNHVFSCRAESRLFPFTPPRVEFSSVRASSQRPYSPTSGRLKRGSSAINFPTLIVATHTH